MTKLQEYIKNTNTEISKLKKKANRLIKIANYLEARSYRDKYFFRNYPVTINDKIKMGYSNVTWLHIVKCWGCYDNDIMFDYETVNAHKSDMPDAPLFFTHYVIRKKEDKYPELCYDTLKNFRKMILDKKLIPCSKEEFEKYLEIAKKEVIIDREEYYQEHKKYESDEKLGVWFNKYVDKKENK